MKELCTGWKKRGKQTLPIPPGMIVLKRCVWQKTTALKNIGKAFVLFTKGEDPEPQLKLLMNKQGFETLAVHLLLIAHIFKKSTIKLRNIFKKFTSYLREDYFQEIIIALLVTLLNEEKYREIGQLDRRLTRPMKSIF